MCGETKHLDTPEHNSLSVARLDRFIVLNIILMCLTVVLSALLASLITHLSQLDFLQHVKPTVPDWRRKTAKKHQSMKSEFVSTTEVGFWKSTN